MLDAPNQDTLDQVLGTVSECLDTVSAQALMRLRAPAELQSRIETLAGRNTEGLLSDEEREEYETLVRVDNFIAILQARARRQVEATTAA